MSSLILPQKWTRQPQTPVEIDWSNPITRGLVVSNTPFTKNNIVTNDAPVLNTGVSVTVDGISTYTATSGLLGWGISTSSNYTFLSFGKFRVGASRIGAIAASGANQTLYFNTLDTGSIKLYKYNGSWPLMVDTGIIGVEGQILNTAVTSNASGVSVFINGKSAGSTATTLDHTNINQAGFIYRQGATTYPDVLKGIGFFLVFNRTLSASEIKSLSDNPWQIFKAPSRKLWVSAGGGTDTPVNPAVGSIAITGYAPAVAQTANQSIAPNVGNIVITGYAPSISQPLAVNPGVGSLTITGYAPTVTQNVDVPVNPGVGTIAITGYAPTVAQTANQSVLPATGTIAITGYSPAVSQTANQAITPDVGTITVTGYAPTVQQAPASQNITPGVGTITITGYAPTVEQSSPLRLGGFEYSNKVYIKRNKKIYIFDSVEEADSYIEAESKVEEIVQQSNKTSRLARKRAREKAFKSLAIEPVDTIDIPALKTLVSQLQTGFELPKLIAQQDWQRVVEIYNQAMEMQDEEDLLLIL